MHKCSVFVLSLYVGVICQVHFMRVIQPHDSSTYSGYLGRASNDSEMSAIIVELKSKLLCYLLSARRI